MPCMALASMPTSSWRSKSSGATSCLNVPASHTVQQRDGFGDRNRDAMRNHPAQKNPDRRGQQREPDQP